MDSAWNILQVIGDAKDVNDFQKLFWEADLGIESIVLSVEDNDPTHTVHNYSFISHKSNKDWVIETGASFPELDFILESLDDERDMCSRLDVSLGVVDMYDKGKVDEEFYQGTRW